MRLQYHGGLADFRLLEGGEKLTQLMNSEESDNPIAGEHLIVDDPGVAPAVLSSALERGWFSTSRRSQRLPERVRAAGVLAPARRPASVRVPPDRGEGYVRAFFAKGQHARGMWIDALKVGVALVALVLAGCSSEQPPPTQPPQPVPTEQPRFATVTPAGIVGLTTHTDSVLGDPYRYFITYPEIAGYQLLGSSLRTAIDAERDRFESERGPFRPTPPEASGPSLNVSFHFLVASGDVLGVELHFYEFFGANGIDRSATFWFDLAEDEALPAVALLNGETATAAVAGELRAALLTGYGEQLFVDQLDEYLAAPERNLRAMAFNEEGDLVVLFDEYSIGPGDLGQIAVALPGDVFEPHLSDFGRRARAETLEASGPPRIPAVTPTATPTETAPPNGTPVPPTSTATVVLTPQPPDRGVDCGVAACVALTFDDGPSMFTDGLLDALAAAGVPATFFVVGVNARLYPDLLARMAAEGHEIGNHSFNHRDLATLSSAQVAEQWASTSTIVEAATGTAPVLFRPPYGTTNAVVRSSVPAPFILWSVDPRDWADRDSATVTQRVLSSASQGDIILLHDIHRTTVEAVSAIVTGLRARGFTLVTVSTLLGEPLQPGDVYYRQR